MLPDVKKITFRSYGGTDRGLEREENEDALLVDDVHKVFAVADGLGGLPQGAYASRLAVEALERILKEREGLKGVDFRDLFQEINKEVHIAGEKVNKELGIGTTLTMAQVTDGEVLIAHVGDTGIFRFRKGECKKLTVDHTMAQEMRSRLDPDEDIYIPEYFSHTLTRCIGQLASLKCDFYRYEIEPGDRLLMFSDGVTKVFEEGELVECVIKVASPQELVNNIIDFANERGGPDNCTAIALFF